MLLLCSQSCVESAVQIFHNLTKSQPEVPSTGEGASVRRVSCPVFTAEEECAAGPHGVAKDCSVVFPQLVLGYF